MFWKDMLKEKKKGWKLDGLICYFFLIWRNKLLAHCSLTVKFPKPHLKNTNSTKALDAELVHALHWRLTDERRWNARWSDPLVNSHVFLHIPLLWEVCDMSAWEARPSSCSMSQFMLCYSGRRLPANEPGEGWDAATFKRSQIPTNQQQTRANFLKSCIETREISERNAGNFTLCIPLFMFMHLHFGSVADLGEALQI